MNVANIIKDAVAGTEFAGKTYFAGGYVRDRILGKPTEDIDIAVELPQGGVKLAQFLFSKGIISKPHVYEDYGTAISFIGSFRIEFVMTRRESYRRGSRKPSTELGSIREDVLRRDFTINSLLMDIFTEEIYDLSGKGICDLRKGLIRATSNVNSMFIEDPLRILRAIRFSNRFHYKIEEETSQSMRVNRQKLSMISWERRREEFTKILLSQTPGEGIKLLFDYNLMNYIIPELVEVRDNLYWSSLEKMPPKLVERLSILLLCLYLKEVNEREIKVVLERLKFSQKTVRNCLIFLNIQRAVELFLAKDKELTLRKVIYKNRCGAYGYKNWLKIHFKAQKRYSEWKRIEKFWNVFTAMLRERNYPLDGDIIMTHFQLKQGAIIGEKLEKGLEIWLQDPDQNQEELLNLLKS